DWSSDVCSSDLIAVVYDNGDVSTYANGELVHFFDGFGAIGDVNPTLNELQIGGRQAGPQFFSGEMAEARVWLTARALSELRANIDRKSVGSEPGRGGYWPFEA